MKALGIEFCIGLLLANVDIYEDFGIDINIDVLPIFKTSGEILWSILGYSRKYKYKPPFVSGIVSGDGKLDPIDLYLQTFLDAIDRFEDKGMSSDGKKVKVMIRCFSGQKSKLLPEIVDQGESPAHGSNEVIREIVACARNAGGEGFSDMQESEISEIVENEGEDLSVEDIENLANESREGEENKSVDGEINMSSSAVLKIIETIQNAIDEAINKDPIMTRCLRFKRACESASKEYEELHRDIVRRARQTCIDQYFYKK
ncbi:hypothetical protein QAD02_010869 [Eretmocerus hayati]|uniref:Uncharacterized protein n=1 Tax=Eretmocerus hayati TaxID=131215 RepID=A0ACC2NV54_9HYME|nr:hypothetical protein QAD02_010869 [Eretmocerus hayati]